METRLVRRHLECYLVEHPLLGSVDGAALFVVGCSLGSELGSYEGSPVGSTDGVSEGESLGAALVLLGLSLG
jgi:hypothetical protein